MPLAFPDVCRSRSLMFCMHLHRSAVMQQAHVTVSCHRPLCRGHRTLSFCLKRLQLLLLALQVDAALDLSHTQNIGRMIKTHFPYSQFIVVSLKEGMFNNANVIYRTKFVDGVSAVTRTVPDKRYGIVCIWPLIQCIRCKH